MVFYLKLKSKLIMLKVWGWYGVGKGLVTVTDGDTKGQGSEELLYLWLNSYYSGLNFNFRSS